jgi:hypothetical protein
MEHLDLNLFPVLTHIDIDGSPGPEFNRVLSLLAPGNRLACIRLLLHNDVDLNNRGTEDFESVILGIGVPALRRVEVKVNRARAVVQPPEDDRVRLIQTALPGLLAKGLLFIVIE